MAVVQEQAEKPGGEQVLSAAELDRVLSQLASRELARWKEPGVVVRAYGVLQGFDQQAAKGWSKVYAVRLQADDGGMSLDGPLAAFDGFHDGDYVEVRGFPVANVYKGRLSFRLDVLSVRPAEGEAVAQMRARERATLEFVRALRPGRHPFPIRAQISISLIHSSATRARVDEDFVRALGEQAGRCSVVSIPVRLDNADAVCAAISQADGDIVALIRGGGDDADFEVFNDRRVLEALARHPGYRIVGLGHSANETLLDFVADHSAAVPSAAGMHIRDQLAEIHSVVSGMEESAEEARRESVSLLDKLTRTQDALRQEQERRARAEAQAMLWKTTPVSRPTDGRARGPRIEKWQWVLLAIFVLWLLTR